MLTVSQIEPPHHHPLTDVHNDIPRGTVRGLSHVDLRLPFLGPVSGFLDHVQDEGCC